MERQPRGYEPTPEPTPNGEIDPTLKAIETGIEAILNEDDFPEYLKTVSRFHQYSYGNVSLIYMQKPDATAVAGYRAWQQMGRQVRAGERGITIVTPRLKKVEDEENPGEFKQVLVGFGFGRVFDVQQTDGDIEVKPSALADAGENLEAAMTICDRVADFFHRDGVLLKPDSLRLRAQQRGAYHPIFRTVVYRPGMPAQDTANTLIHEMAHHIVFSRPWGGEPKKRGDHEVVAQGAAYAALSRYGLDVSEYTFHYLKNWADGDLEVVKSNLNAIQKTTHMIVEELERPREKWLSDRGITSTETTPESP